MSLLPPLFRRGERLLPLGAALRPTESQPAARSATDWACATPRDGAPKQVRLHLTEWAQAEAGDFEAVGLPERGCVCWTGCAPCSFCTHPGNPLNLEEDDSAWVYGYSEGAAS